MNMMCEIDWQIWRYHASWLTMMMLFCSSEAIAYWCCCKAEWIDWSNWSLIGRWLLMTEYYRYMLYCTFCIWYFAIMLFPFPLLFILQYPICFFISPLSMFDLGIGFGLVVVDSWLCNRVCTSLALVCLWVWLPKAMLLSFLKGGMIPSAPQ